MKYCKFIDTTHIEFPPVNKGSVINYDICEELLLQDGYKPFQEAEKPTGNDYTITYQDTPTAVIEIVTLPTPEEIAEREKQRILGLSCTKRVFTIILQDMGVTYAQLKTLIASSEQAQMEWDLCERLYRFNPLLDVMAAQLGFTSEQVDNIFKIANGEIPSNIDLGSEEIND